MINAEMNGLPNFVGIDAFDIDQNGNIDIVSSGAGPGTDFIYIHYDDGSTFTLDNSGGWPVVSTDLDDDGDIDILFGENEPNNGHINGIRMMEIKIGL